MLDVSSMSEAVVLQSVPGVVGEDLVRTGEQVVLLPGDVILQRPQGFS